MSDSVFLPPIHSSPPGRPGRTVALHEQAAPAEAERLLDKLGLTVP
ncbi:MAG: hypothetical protein J2P48_12360 [Alphaproteobacteria bacterium]|nr:hypothetical protein [Alphaproteobacteria bacterium]